MEKLIVLTLNFLLNLTLPAILVLILLLVIFIFYRKKISRYLLLTTIIVFYFVANGVIPRLLITPLENHLSPINKATVAKYHAMVVLGAGITQAKRQTTIGLLGYSRIVEAVKLYQQGLQQDIHYIVFLSGGATSKSHLTEAQLYQTALIKMGIPSQQIILENNSRNTFQNAKFVKPLLQQYHINKALLVTGGLHMRRALQYFAYFKIKVAPAVADFPYPHVSWIPLTYNLTYTELALHEWYGIGRLALYNFLGLNRRG